MPNWQYAWLTDQPYTTIGFSHPQPGLAAELAGVLGVGVFAAQSNEWSISLDRSRVNLGYVSGLMGDRGWEMFSVETRLQPGAITPAQLQTNWYFKKQGPDRASSAGMGTATAGASMGSGGPMGSMMSTSMPDAAPPMQPAPQMQEPQMQPAPATYSAPEMAPAAPPAAQMPAPPAPPPGPDQAPMSPAATPPPGPEGTQMPSQPGPPQP